MSKIGLCLSGGGSRGAYQIGVAKALEELGLLGKINAYAGTSIGSVNAALLATMTPDEAMKLWLNTSVDEIKSTEGTFRRLMQERIAVVDKGIYNIAPLEKRLHAYLDPNAIKDKEIYITLSRGGASNESIIGLMKSLYRHFIKHETNVLYPNIALHPFEEAVRMILASCSIPVAFPAVIDGERKYYDGGLYDNVPVKPLFDNGCDIIVVVHLFGLEFIEQSRYPNCCFHEIRPSVPLGWLLNFDPAKAEKLYHIGHDDAIAHFRNHPAEF